MAINLTREDNQMRQTGWYRVKSDGAWDFAYYNNGYWSVIGTDELDFQDHDFDEINEELQNPEPIKRTDFAGFVNPKKTGLDGDGHPIEVKP